MSIEPRTTTVTIYGGDYLDRLGRLEREAQAAAEKATTEPKRSGTKSEAIAKAEEYDALLAEAEADALHVTLRALRRSEWKTLVKEHPPRKDHKDDEAAGVNEETFKDALVTASVVEPTLSADDFDALADVDFDRLYFSAFALNRMSGGDPKAGLVSRLNLRSDETSS
jgi:hypothetical protein